MESEKEHTERSVEEELGEQGEHVKHSATTSPDDTRDHGQASAGSGNAWSDTERCGSALDVRKVNGNNVLKQTLQAVRRDASKAQTAVSANAYHKLLLTTIEKRVHPQDVADTMLTELKNVKQQMRRLLRYIEAQTDEDKPLYHWAAYDGYPALNTAVSKLRKAMTKFKAPRLPQEYLSKRLTCATDFSLSVSTCSADALAAMNKKTTEYMDAMEASTLNEDSKAQANAVITEEVCKLLEHCTSATGTVWQATDLLRKCKEQQAIVRGWAWSASATAMTAFVATVVSLATTYFYGPAYLDMFPARAGGPAVYSKIVDLVQQTQVVTNLTGELYKIKMQDVDLKYDDLSALSQAHGLRIDGIVDGLGPPNQQGTYYVSTTKSDDGSCESRIQNVSKDLQSQLQRQQQELELMRKNMHRMDVRLTRGIEKVRKE